MSKPNYHIIVSFTSCGPDPDSASEVITNALDLTWLKDYYEVIEVEKE